MNDYKNKIIVRMVYSCAIVFIFLIVMFISNMGLIEFPAVKTDFFRGFINGLCFAVVAKSVFNIVNYLVILNDSKKLKEQYIKENDELKKKIVDDVGTNEYDFVGIGRAVGVMIGGYVNIYVFWSFYFALLYYCLIRGLLCFLYKRKYKSDEEDSEE